MGFTTFGLSDHIMQGIRSAGYTTPTPIQSLAIRPALEGKDIIGSAQTGTGKTAAFVLPMLHRLTANNGSQNGSRHPRALVLAPTRELAHQVQDAVVTYGKFLQIRAVAIYGGVNMEGQFKALRRGVDIIIATPGRLLDHMQRRTVDLSEVEILIVDEADRMLDMGFIKDVRRIIAAVPTKRQTMLFSATISNEITDLAARILHDPHKVEVGERRNPVETITQYFYSATPSTKMELLLHTLESEKMDSVLVFSRTKHGADKISRRLERAGVKAMAIHSNRTQSQRQRALDGFKAGRCRVLVATDIAARGIDVEGISHVINYDIPQHAEDYIHRIGRTGRAGASGDALTFVSNDEHKHLKNIERFTGKRFQLKKYIGFSAKSAGQPSDRPGHASTSEPSAVQTLSASQPAVHPRPHQPAKRKNHAGHSGNWRRGSVNSKSPRKKVRGRNMESFSSDSGGAGWSNR